MINFTMAEDMSSYIHKGLSEWWSEESEYLFQRIERWAAFSRGYNRLKSIRLSKARMTMNDQPNTDLYWRATTSSNYSIKRSQSPNETGRINCCGTFNYQSNSHFNSSCLETYRYDHSIYFKTIGDIKNNKKELGNNNDDQSNCEYEVDKDQQCQYYCCNNNQQDELDVRLGDVDCKSSEKIEYDDAQVNVVTPNGDVRWDYLYTSSTNKSDDLEIETIFNNTRSIDDPTIITEMSNLQINNKDEQQSDDNDSNNNNNCNNHQSQCQVLESDHQQSKNISENSGFSRMLNFRKPKKSSSKIVSQSVIVLGDNVMWPGVFLNYKNTTDPSTLSASYQHNALNAN